MQLHLPAIWYQCIWWCISEEAGHHPQPPTKCHWHSRWPYHLGQQGWWFWPWWSTNEISANNQKNGLKINIDKIQYKAKEVSFFGETYTTNGHRPSAEKIKAIQDMPVLTNVTELQTFLGMCQYLAKYSARTAELSEPLWQLTCKHTPFTWGPEHDEALNALKKEISASPTLRYYDPHQPLMFQTDAYRKGLGAVLLQNGQPVYFASKTLHGSKKNYVAIELEALTVSWAIEKFHHYLYSYTFTLQTDQKPLVSILGHSLLKASKTMQSLLMKTIPYHFDVEYIKGSTNVITDCLSCAPITTASTYQSSKSTW